MRHFLTRLGIRLLGRSLPAETKSRLSAMAAELERADPIYLPSRFWTDLNKVNEAQLADAGFENFKRTINQNYFNWGPSSFDDNQLRNLLTRWAAQPSADPMLATLEGDYELFNMFNQNMLDTSEKAKIYAFFVGLLWWFAAKDDPDNLTGRLSEPLMGNPLKIRLGDRLISQDLANSIRERNAIWRHASDTGGRKRTIAEIGAGYGRLAYACLAASDCRYLIFDVPPALYVSERYLSSVFPEKRIFRFRPFARFAEIEDELVQADICFFTANQVEFFPAGYFDMCASVSALHEMRAEQIANFLAKMSALTSNVIYLKNWRQWHNSADDVRIDESTFRLPAPWQVALDRVDPVQNMFSEKVFVRKR